MKHLSLVSLALALAVAALPAAAHAQAGAAAASKLHVDTQYFTLPNGLRVVL
ncbi:hypothetical protein GY973_23585, partial [Escherichia coli]|nr:hypothetical protein [Escherichia coli]